jgi:hypothetical protein
MSRPITISIPKPCHENWQDMTATERGAFCKSCQKEVIDFTKKTEDETHRILSSGGATCGRFRTDQLERPIHQTTYIKSWWHWKAISASVFGFLGYQHSKANTDNNVYTIVQSDTARQPHYDTLEILKTDTAREIEIKGIVIDENREGIMGAVIVMENKDLNFRVGVQSDSNGLFNYKVNSLNFPLIAKIQFIGYQSKTITIPSPPKNQLEIELNQYSLNDMMGMVSYYRPRDKIRHFFYRIFPKRNKPTK